MPRGVKPKTDSRDEIAYENYRQNWGLIKKHMATGAYVEVLNAVERIIHARLMTYLTDCTEHDTSNLDYHDSTFNGLIRLWNKYQPNPINDKRYENLQAAVDTWRKKRNKGTHAGLKRVPGKQLTPFKDLESANKAACEEGILLAKSVQNWLDRVKYKMEKVEGKALLNSRHK